VEVEIEKFARREPSRNERYGFIKTAGDFCTVCVLAVFAFPLIAVLALLVKRASPGPAFYKQTRLGLHGRPFQIWKLRTMSHNCEAASGPVWCGVNDSRVTPIGRVLRETHLDELPQLWNVLRGEMSLVGPRPERPEIARRIEVAVPGFSLRLQVKPGLTGLAQLRLPADQDIAYVPRKLAQDLHYMRHQGLLLDLYLVISTAFHVLGTACMCVSKLLVNKSVPATPHEPGRPDVQPHAANMDSQVKVKREESDMVVELSAAA
jgi:lipopolysaccharide/colanic/teichoic acid biosynthesis glycosyltransferase